MAIFHMGSITIATRGKGRSSVAHAAYQSGRPMTNQWDGHRQTKVTKQEVLFHAVLLPENAPAEYKDAETLWNSVELNEKRIDAQLCRYFDVEFQDEFSFEENKKLVLDFVKKNMVDEGMCAQIDIHKKENERTHAHIMLTMRQIDEKGKWIAKAQKKYLCRNDAGEECYLSGDEFKNEKTAGWQKVFRYVKDDEVLQLTQKQAEAYPDHVRKSKDPVSKKVDINDAWNRKDLAVKWRESWADMNNEIFKKKGLNIRISHKSYEDQELPLLPKESYTRAEWEMKQRGVVTEKEKRNNLVDEFNADLLKIKKYGDAAVTVSRQLYEDLKTAYDKDYLIEPEQLSATEEAAKLPISMIDAIVKSGLFYEKHNRYWKSQMNIFKRRMRILLDQVWEKINGPGRDNNKVLMEQQTPKKKTSALDDLIGAAKEKKAAWKRSRSKGIDRDER